MVIGSVSSGKTALLNALLKEMETPDGTPYCELSGRVAYVPQNVWLQQGSIRDNVLFGKPYDVNLYQKSVTLSQLSYDLLALPNSDDYGDISNNLSF